VGGVTGEKRLAHGLKAERRVVFRGNRLSRNPRPWERQRAERFALDQDKAMAVPSDHRHALLVELDDRSGCQTLFCGGVYRRPVTDLHGE